MEEEQKEFPKKMGIQKTTLSIVFTILIALLLMYLFLSLYFIKHFCWGTRVNDLKVGGKSITKVEKMLISQKETYELLLKERGAESEIIKATDIGIEIDVKEKLQELKHGQNGFGWLFKLGHNWKYTLEDIYTYDEAKLNNVIKALKCLDKAHNKVPHNASVIYEKNSFVIKEGDQGNLINREIFFEKIKKAISNATKEIDLEKEKCYEEAQYQIDSQPVIDVQRLFNNYLKSEVTYQIGTHREKLTKNQIKNWLKVDENMKGTLDRSQVESYIERLAEKYNTVGKTRKFKTSSGNTIQISGGDYGWAMDETKEIHELINVLHGYKAANRSPIFSQTAKIYDIQNDIGDTYVEVNLTTQYLWLYHEGNLVAEGDIVSGTADGKHETPVGVYNIDYMKRNAILKGTGYSCPVAFWMPFNGDIGLHDATWRGRFGGDIYLSNGSHGCINCPYSLVETIFNNVEPGTAVVCYE